MKRDMDLARRILLAVYAREDAIESKRVYLEFEGVTKERISHHVKLLRDADLLVAMEVCASEDDDQGYWVPTRLTSDGRDFVGIFSPRLRTQLSIFRCEKPVDDTFDRPSTEPNR